MNTLDMQLSELYDWSISQHGYKLINNSNVVDDALRGYIVKLGLEGVKKHLSDISSPVHQYIYNLIDSKGSK